MRAKEKQRYFIGQQKQMDNLTQKEIVKLHNLLIKGHITEVVEVTPTTILLP